MSVKKLQNDIYKTLSCFYKNEESNHRKFGKKLADELLSHSTDSLTLRYSISEFLMTLYKSQPDDDCGQQLLNWSMDQFWAIEVKRHIPIFHEIYDSLKNLGARYKNPLVYGDIDYSVWIDNFKDIKVIASICHPSMADDNTYIFILNDRGVFGNTFHARSAWPREIISKYGRKNWPNDSCWRDIKQPSYLTYKRHEFTLGYEDQRDKGYCFTYGGILQSGVQGQSEIIKHALSTLTNIKEGIKDPLYLPKIK